MWASLWFCAVIESGDFGRSQRGCLLESCVVGLLVGRSVALYVPTCVVSSISRILCGVGHLSLDNALRGA